MGKAVIVKSFNIYLLRHGEITHTSSLAGHTDFKVTNAGLQQMAEAVIDLQVQHCICSPLSRCLDFAKLISSERDIELTVEPNLIEMDFGDWDGKDYDFLWQQPKPNIGDFWQSPFQYSPPNGETFSELTLRVGAWWKTFTADVNQDTLIVTHAGVIKCLLALVLSESEDQSHIGKIATTVSVGYGHVVQLSCFTDEEHCTYVQVKL